MRVLHVVESLSGGGAETLVRELVPRLQRRGIEIEVLSSYGARLDAAQRAALAAPVHEAHKAGRLDLAFGLRFTRMIARRAPDIVHAHGFAGKYWGRACAMAARVPCIIYTEHNPWPHMGAWERPASAMLARYTAAVVTFSERTHAFIRAREPLPSAVAVIPNGIEIAPEATPEDRASARALLESAVDEIAVGIVANLTHYKNHALALSAFGMLSSTLRERARLHLFGAGPLEAALRAQAEALGISERLRFWGFTSNVRRLLPGLDIALTVATVEAAPISLLEAMSARLPVIGTPHVGTLDMVRHEHTGLITADWSAQSVAYALERAAADAAWRANAGAAARALLEAEYDIELTADRHATLYRS